MIKLEYLSFKRMKQSIAHVSCHETKAAIGHSYREITKCLLFV